MKTTDFDYTLPEGLIAQTPVEPRDASRLLICHRDGRPIEHRAFHDILDYLNPGDALVINDTRTIPARLIGRRPSGGAVQVLLLKRLDADRWEAIVRPGKKLRPGAVCLFGETNELVATIESETAAAGGRVVRFIYEGVFEQVLDRLGTMPLPPYIHEKLQDPARYNTVYARADGSAATPTAGLHFTPALLEAARAKGVTIVRILLHVGLGTFRPVQAEDVAQHVMHQEHYEVAPGAADALNAVRAMGGRIICVGTTSVRTLETVTGADGVVRPGSGETDIFITPGYRFHATDALITNFHLPKSTLLMLVSALLGRERTLAAYAEAVRCGYRFFSFGDAMLID